MKITNVITIEDDSFIVFFEPNFLEKLFGIKPKKVQYVDTGKYYTFTGLTKYSDKNGDVTFPHSAVAKAIDKHIRSELYKVKFHLELKS